MRTASLSKDSQEQLLQDFCEALAVLRTSQEVLPFLTDLLTRTELMILTKRLGIAKFLLDGKEYRTIETSLRVSHGTIARVAAWLAEAGEGFRLVAERTKKQGRTPKYEEKFSEWNKLKRRYPMMFWPQLLLEAIVRNATAQQKEKLQKAVEKLDHKSKVYHRMGVLFRSPGKTKLEKSSMLHSIILL